MGVRRKAREGALKALFENDFSDKSLMAIVDQMQIEQQLEVDVTRFLQQLLQVFKDHQKQIDDTIEKYSAHWKLNRMASVDRNILRLGVAEILYLEDVPKNVTINEYLEVAKKFGTEDSSSFVNGILDKINKE